MDKVQFREDPALLEFVKSRGLNPNEVARAAFEAEVRRMKADNWLERIRELQKNMKPLGQPAAEILREMREERGQRFDDILGRREGE